MDTVRRRRERKILKIYRKLAVKRDERLVHRLRCLQQAEVNEMKKRNKSPLDMAAFEADLRRADEILKAHE